VGLLSSARRSGKGDSTLPFNPGRSKLRRHIRRAAGRVQSFAHYIPACLVGRMCRSAARRNLILRERLLHLPTVKSHCEYAGTSSSRTRGHSIVLLRHRFLLIDRHSLPRSGRTMRK
jgi:hypothetical protein